MRNLAALTHSSEAWGSSLPPARHSLTALAFLGCGPLALALSVWGSSKTSVPTPGPISAETACSAIGPNYQSFVFWPANQSSWQQLQYKRLRAFQFVLHPVVIGNIWAGSTLRKKALSFLSFTWPVLPTVLIVQATQLAPVLLHWYHPQHATARRDTALILSVPPLFTMRVMSQEVE